MFAGTNPSVLIDKTKSARDGLKTAHTETCTNLESIKIEKESKADEDIGFRDDEFNTSPDLSSSDDTRPKIKLKDLSKLVQTIDVDFIDLDSPKDDEPIIVQNDIDEEVHAEKAQNSKLKKEKTEAEAEVAFLSAQPSYQNVVHLTKLLVKSLQPKLSKILSSHDFSSSLPTDLKELPSKFNELTREIKALKKHVHDLEIELPGDLKEIPTKLETFTSTVKSPLKSSSQSEGELIKKDKGKEAISSKDAEEECTRSDFDNDTINLAGSVVKSSKEKKLKKFDFVTKGGDHVHLTEEQIKEQKRIEEFVYREDGTNEVISNFKASDLHLSEWREVIKACPNRKIVGWSTIYEQIQTRMDYLYKTEAELRIDLDKPLGEQDPLDKLNDLARKKRKHADDIHDLLRSTKKFKSSVQYGDHPAGTVLNEAILGMNLFNSFHRQDFVTIEDFEDFPNEMLYTVQEIFFRLH
ncbi:hypothetical protein Tco_1192717 [Tanacetum coccineum]